MVYSERNYTQCSIHDTWYENSHEGPARLTKLSGGFPGVIIEKYCSQFVLPAKDIGRITSFDGGLELVSLNNAGKNNPPYAVYVYSEEKKFLDSIKTCFEKYMAETISQNFSGC